jgi:hypothetical protein
MSLNAERRAQGRRWLNAWREAGAVLEAERQAHLRALDDDSSWEEAQALFALWEPDWAGDAGDGLLHQQFVFARQSRRLTR